MKSRWDAGQFKLRGKKHRHLTCGCCTLENWKDDCRKKEAEKEIKQYSKEEKNEQPCN